MDQKKWLNHFSLFSYLKYFNPDSSSLNDKEVVSLLVHKEPDNFTYASKELRSDSDFVLELAERNCRNSRLCYLSQMTTKTVPVAILIELLFVDESKTENDSFEWR